MIMKYHIVANAQASSVARLGERVFTNLAEQILGSSLASVEITSCEDLKEVFNHYAQNINDKAVILACGGDGTARTAALSALKHNVALGILPGGTFNTVSRALRVGGDLKESLERYAQSPLKSSFMDAGYANGQIFLSTLTLYGGSPLVESMKAARNFKSKRELFLSLSGFFDFASGMLKEHDLYEFFLDGAMDEPEEFSALDRHDIFQSSRILVTNGEFDTKKNLIELLKTPRGLRENHFGVYAGHPERWRDIYEAGWRILEGEWAHSRALKVLKTKSLTVRQPSDNPERTGFQAQLDGEHDFIEGQELKIRNHKAEIPLILPENSVL